MTERKFTIELTDEERRLLGKVQLEALAVKGGHLAVRENGSLAAELFERLLERNAIPKHRLDYFTNPELNIGGRGTSRLRAFERNGTKRPDIPRHPHFLKYLRYFIFGPNLPEEVLAAFGRKVDECGMVTSGDIIPLANFAKTQVRTNYLDPRDCSEEFFKLGLEHGLGPDYSCMIRNKVRAIR